MYLSQRVRDVNSHLKRCRGYYSSPSSTLGRSGPATQFPSLYVGTSRASQAQILRTPHLTVLCSSTCIPTWTLSSNPPSTPASPYSSVSPQTPKTLYSNRTHCENLASNSKGDQARLYDRFAMSRLLRRDSSRYIEN